MGSGFRRNDGGRESRGCSISGGWTSRYSTNCHAISRCSINRDSINDRPINANATYARPSPQAPQRSNIAIDSTCPVCGNMSITPAARSFQPFSRTR